jgi:hypothetical protein
MSQPDRSGIEAATYADSRFPVAAEVTSQRLDLTVWPKSRAVAAAHHSSIRSTALPKLTALGYDHANRGRRGIQADRKDPAPVTRLAAAPTADDLRAQLADALVAAGAITTPAVERAVRTVPREVIGNEVAGPGVWRAGARSRSGCQPAWAGSWSRAVPPTTWLRPASLAA